MYLAKGFYSQYNGMCLSAVALYACVAPIGPLHRASSLSTLFYKAIITFECVCVSVMQPAFEWLRICSCVGRLHWLLSFRYWVIVRAIDHVEMDYSPSVTQSLSLSLAFLSTFDLMISSRLSRGRGRGPPPLHRSLLLIPLISSFANDRWSVDVFSLYTIHLRAHSLKPSII